MAIISLPGDGPPGVPQNAVEQCVKSRIKNRGEFIENSWAGEDHVIEVQGVSKKITGHDSDLALPNNVLEWELKVHPLVYGLSHSEILKGIDKLTVITHATVLDTGSWVRGGVFSGFKPNRAIIWGEEFAGFLNLLGFEGRSIDIIGCLSALFAKSLSNMLPGAKIKGYVTPVNIDTSASLLAPNMRPKSGGKVAPQSYPVVYPASPVYANAASVTGVAGAKKRFVQGSEVQKGNRGQAFTPGNEAVKVRNHTHSAKVVGELAIPVGSAKLPSSIMDTSYSAPPSSLPAKQIVLNLNNFRYLRRDVAAAVAQFDSIARKSGLRIFVLGAKDNTLFSFVLEEVAFKAEDLAKAGYRLSVTPILGQKSISTCEIRFHFY
jgi:hypothetical protein